MSDFRKVAILGAGTLFPSLSLPNMLFSWVQSRTAVCKAFLELSISDGHVIIRPGAFGQVILARKGDKYYALKKLNKAHLKQTGLHVRHIFFAPCLSLYLLMFAMTIYRGRNSRP